MTSYIKISNRGNMELGALTLLGASTKDDDETKIGFFGTGAKYSLAFLLRNDVEFYIFVDNQKVMVTTETEILRGRSFDVICINGVKTSMTTEMGKDWEAWFIIREIYCNALDESSPQINIVEYDDNDLSLPSRAGYTEFYIAIDPMFSEIVDPEEWGKYFCQEREPIYSSPYGQLLAPISGTVNVYRQGIRCFNGYTKSLYDYNIKAIDINEMREVKYSTDVYTRVWQILASCQNKHIINNILNNICNDYNDNSYIEYDIGYARSQDIKGLFSLTWEECVKGRLFITPELLGLVSSDEHANLTIIPRDLLLPLQLAFGDSVKMPTSLCGFDGDVQYKEITLSAGEQLIMDSAIRTLESYRFNIKYEIKYVQFANTHIMGRAIRERNLILVGEGCINKGEHYIMSTLIEEHTHIKTGVRDETREMQDALLDLLIVHMRESYEREKEYKKRICIKGGTWLHRVCTKFGYTQE